VMLVDIEVAASFELEIEPAVMREQLEHVIEKTNSSRNLIVAAAFDRERHLYTRLLAHTLDAALSHRTHRATPCAVPSSSNVS
jgi:hypothetical protein